MDNLGQVKKFLQSELPPGNQFEQDFLAWYNSFADYKKTGELYGVSTNKKYLSYLQDDTYYVTRIKERFCIKVLEALYPTNAYFIGTDFDDFSYGVDCIERNEKGEFTAIDITTNRSKVPKYDRTHIRPVDFLRSTCDLRLRVQGIKRKDIYFDSTGVHNSVNMFLQGVREGKIIERVDELYFSQVTREAMLEANQYISDNVEIII